MGSFLENAGPRRGGVLANKAYVGCIQWNKHPTYSKLMKQPSNQCQNGFEMFNPAPSKNDGAAYQSDQVPAYVTAPRYTSCFLCFHQLKQVLIKLQKEVYMAKFFKRHNMICQQNSFFTKKSIIF